MVLIRLQKIIADKGICSRRKAEELILAGKVKVNGEIAKIGMKFDPEKDKLEMAGIDNKLKDINSQLLYIVINKPVGCAAHPSPGWTGATVVGALTAAGYSVSTSGAAERAGIVHRLDVGTSGLMVVAKTDQAYTFLKAAFKNREVEKIYHALVQGHMDPSTGTIDAPIDRHPKEDYRFAVVAGGKTSITHYEVIEFFRAVSLVKVELETGRTHQIRVHFSALRHPLVGDLTYGADPTLAARLEMSRPWLHALELRFRHPVTNMPLDFRAPYPEDLKRALALLESSART